MFCVQFWFPDEHGRIDLNIVYFSRKYKILHMNYYMLFLNTTMS